METDYNTNWKEPCPKAECKQPSFGLKYVSIPASLTKEMPPKNGAFSNAVVRYEENGDVWIYSAEGVPTRVEGGSSAGEVFFNNIIGRPRYGGSRMTSNTDIPQVPTSTSQLTNDSDYQTSSDVAAAIAISPAFKPFPASVNTTGTTQQFMNSILALDPIVGTAYLGTVSLSDMPTGLTQEEVEVYVYSDYVIYCIMRSTDVSPYAWWCASYNYQGWMPSDTTYSAFTGATTLQAGTSGLVPAPTTSDPDKYLKGDGTWATPPDTTYTAGTNVQISSSNVISATDTTYSNFTGTDGQTAGAAGLVPAPATTDAGKFLKADGTWDDAAGSTYTAGDGIDITNNVIKATNTGKARVLTTDDYDYPTASPDGVALWKLDEGVYFKNSDVKVYQSTTDSEASNGALFLIGGKTVDKVNIVMESNNRCILYLVDTVNGARQSDTSVLTTSDIINNLTSSSSMKALSAKQGKVLKDLVDSLAFKNAGAPTTSTVGTVGQLLEDTTNGKLYICTAIVPGTAPDPDTYTWEEVGGGSGGSGITELTSTDYNWPENNPDGIAFWKLNDGIYHMLSNVKFYYDSTGNYDIERLIIVTTETGYKNCTDIIPHNIYYRRVNQSGVSIWGYPQRVLTTDSITQSTGTSTTDVMSQNAVTSMVFADPSTKHKIQLGASASATGNAAIAIGSAAMAQGNYNISIGDNAFTPTNIQNSIALGRRAYPTRTGEVNVSTGNETTAGFNSSNYRVIGGVYDGQNNHDAATVAQGNKLMTAAPTTTDAGVLGQLWTDTTNMHTYQLGSIDETDPSNPVYNWVQRW